MLPGNLWSQSRPSSLPLSGISVSRVGDAGVDVGPAEVSRASEVDLPRILTPEELAAILRLRKRSVYEAINRGDIPGVRRIGRKIRIDRDCVLAWLSEGHGRVSRSSRR
jgi:excisionase family DNA binding protein